MNAISIFNPFSEKYHAIEQFSELTLEQKIVTIALTLLATVASLFLATTAVFRSLVNHFYVVIDSTKETNGALPGLSANSDQPKILLAIDTTKKRVPAKKIGGKETEVKEKKALGPELVNTAEAPGQDAEKKASPAVKRMVEKTRRRARSLDSSDFVERVAVRRALDMAAFNTVKPSFSKAEELPSIDQPVHEKDPAAQTLTLDEDDAALMLARLSELAGVAGTSEVIELDQSSLDFVDSFQNEDQDQILEQLKGIAETTLEQKKILNQTVREELEVYCDEGREEETLPEFPQEEAAEADNIETTSDLFTSIIDKTQARRDLGLEEGHCNMVNYIIRYIREWVASGDNETKHIRNTDPVTFREGAIVKAEDDLSALKAVHYFFHFLKETFGTHLADGVFKRYSLFNKKAVSLQDIKQAMIAVASRVTENDLKMLFEHVRLDKPGALTSYRAGDLLYQINDRLYLQIRGKKTFDQLSTDEINFLHSAFRTVSFSQLGYEGLDVLFHIKKDFVPQTVLDNAKDPRDVKAKIRETEITDYETFLFGKDIDALILMESWKDLDLTYPELAMGEWIGKSLAYQELKPGLILPMPMIENLGAADVSVPKLYKVAKSLPSKKDAVIAHVIAPLNEHQSIWPKNPDSSSEDVFLAFRGSMAGANVDSGMTWVRDFHHQGVGRVTYDAREAEIQAMVEEYLEGTSCNSVTLRVTGHSLGACDCQRGLVSVLEKIAASEEGSPWRKVKRVVLTSFNAPKVNPTVNKRMKEAVRTINQKAIDVAVDVKHLRFYDKSHEDHVQWGGDILLGADYHGGTGEEVFKHAHNVTRTIVKVLMDEDKGLSGEGVLARHGNRTFNKAICNVPFRIETLSGEIETERLAMEKEMAGNYYWNEDEMTEGQKIIGNITWYASWFGLRQPGKVLRAVLINAPHQVALKMNRYQNGSIYEMLDQARNS
ncbi:hypothetical protein [Estrella lausannensis]|uniref:Putative membrane protein n=1 Tax=Estrella lausannensis TaxID=483423 RepID=A0A0H5DQ27_9BACT|nr:hypothetical protein [Estrella lausannensis]CRX38148.1 putative membrane protein [Estrella lausannensis]